MEFHVIELPKLPEKLKENSSDLLLWAKFINAERKEEFDMLADKNASIEKAYERLQVISQDQKKRMEYEAREKAIRDHNQMMKEAVERGLKQGMTMGRLEVLFDLVRDGTLTISVAAEAAAMELSEFEQQYNENLSQLR